MRKKLGVAMLFVFLGSITTFGSRADATPPAPKRTKAKVSARSMQPKRPLVRVGINGFGRIGRQVLKAIMQNHGDRLQVVAINDLGNAQQGAQLLKHDTSYGTFPTSVSARKNALVVGGKRIRYSSERDPAKIPWEASRVDLVIEASGAFTDGNKARAHLRPTKGGPKKVIIGAPAKNEDLTVVLGINEKLYRRREHNVISMASCTTNCAAPILKVLNEQFGVRQAILTTTHAVTNNQRIQDSAHKDPRRGRAAFQNIIPTKTGAAVAVGQVLPELKGKVDGLALRVPTPTVSVVDITATLKRNVTPEQLNHALKAASKKRPMRGVLAYSTEPLVSSDYIGNPASATVDGAFTKVVNRNMAHVLGWYDNEWGYSSRVADLAALVAKKGIP